MLPTKILVLLTSIGTAYGGSEHEMVPEFHHK